MGHSLSLRFAHIDCHGSMQKRMPPHQKAPTGVSHRDCSQEEAPDNAKCRRSPFSD